MTVTALVTMKVCPNCGRKSPLMDPASHEPDCSGEYVMTTEMGTLDMPPGAKVVPVEIRWLE